MLREQIHFLETLSNREAACAITDNHDVIGALHHGFSEPRNILDAPHGSDRTCAVRRPVHDAGVKLDLAFFVGQPAIADGIIVGIVFDNSDSGDDRVKRVATFFKNVHPAAKRVDPVRTGDDDRTLA